MPDSYSWLGQLGMSIPGNIQSGEINEQTIQMNRLKVQQAQQDAQAQNALKGLLSQPGMVDPQTGMPTNNALGRIMQIDPVTGMKLQDQISKNKLATLKANLDLQSSGIKLNDDQQKEIKTSIIDPAENAYDDNFSQYGSVEQANAAAQRVVDANRAQLEKSGMFAGGQLDRVPTKYDHQLFGAAAISYKDKQTLKEKSEADARADAAQAERERHDRATEDPGSPMNDDAINYAADRYRETGNLPPMGMGKAGAAIRSQIIQRAADKAKSEGGDASTDISTQSGLKGDQSALTQLSKTRANVANFEGTARREADLALSLAPKGEAGQIPVLNRWIQSGRKQVMGDGDVSAFDTALTSFKNEYARIMSSPGAAGGVTSDAARHEAEGLINDAQSPDQLQKNIATMKLSMQNRIDAINEEYDATKKRIANAGKTPSKSSETALPTVSDDAGYGKLKSGDHFLAPDGKEYIKP